MIDKAAQPPTSTALKPSAAFAYFRGLRHHATSTLAGMRITMKHLLHLGRGADKHATATYQYPDEGLKRMAEEVAQRHRGLIYLEPSKCVMCMACERVCPTQCIVIEGVRLKTDNFMTRFTVDNSKCMFCGLCTEVCPADCIHHGREWDYAAFTRDGMVRDLLRGKLFTPADYIQSKRDLELAKSIEANFKQEEAALKAKADAEKKAAAAKPVEPTQPVAENPKPGA